MSSVLAKEEKKSLEDKERASIIHFSHEVEILIVVRTQTSISELIYNRMSGRERNKKNIYMCLSLGRVLMLVPSLHRLIRIRSNFIDSSYCAVL